MKKKFNLKSQISNLLMICFMPAILLLGWFLFSSLMACSPADPMDVSIKGSFSHTTFKSGQTGSVSFNRFPATVDEFKKVRDQIGAEPHGAIALNLMAFEMYRKNRKIGEECIKLVNANNNSSSIIGRLQQLFGNDDNYNRPYQVAAFLKGATPENGYNPTKPYTFEFTSQIGSDSYQQSSIYQSTVISIRVLTKGRDMGYQPASVVKTLKPGEVSEGKYFMITSCSGLYFQVAPISFAAPFNGLD
jgi:hypothetical protein